MLIRKTKDELAHCHNIRMIIRETNTDSKNPKQTLTLRQQTTDAETISFMLCFSFRVVFKFTAVTIRGGISKLNFEEVEILMSLGESTITSNLHQLTCKHSAMIKMVTHKN